MVDLELVKDALQKVRDPELQKGLMELGMIRNRAIEDGRVSLSLTLTTCRCPHKEELLRSITMKLKSLQGVTDVEVRPTTMSKEEAMQLFSRHPLAGLNRVRHVLAVASGKGGVGKTTVAVNTALALANEGYQVGLLDADVYGPSVPVMLALQGSPESENSLLLPVEKYRLRTMSLGMMVKGEEAFIWRGPMVGKAIRQLLDQVLWGELDYLVVDLPPGTGDPSITVAQSIVPKASVLMVTTPQEVALADVRRAVELFRKFEMQIVGLIENMSYFTCDHSSEPIEIFGHGGGVKLSQELNLPLIGTIPIELQIRESGDIGKPLMISASGSEAGHIFKSISRQILEDFGDI